MFLSLTLTLASCNKDEKILDSLNNYNTSMETKGYHFGDKIEFPKEVTENAESISISFGDKEIYTGSSFKGNKLFSYGIGYIHVGPC